MFSGAKRTVDINLNKLVSIAPYNDGIAVRTSGRQKTQYFVGIDMAIRLAKHGIVELLFTGVRYSIKAVNASKLRICSERTD